MKLQQALHIRYRYLGLCTVPLGQPGQIDLLWHIKHRIKETCVVQVKVSIFPNGNLTLNYLTLYHKQSKWHEKQHLLSGQGWTNAIIDLQLCLDGIKP